MHPLKLIKIKNPFGFLQTNLQILAEQVEPIFFHQKHVFVKHPNGHLVQEVVAEVKDSGVGGEGGEGCQVSPRAIHPHCVAHILPCLAWHNIQTKFLSPKIGEKLF